MIKIGGDQHEVTGRKLNYKGYVCVLIKSHPNADSNGYVLEHRVVMEMYLGRYLKSYKQEMVHHIDGDKQNNDINNLELMDTGTHTKLTHLGLKRNLETKKKQSEVAKKRFEDKKNHPAYTDIDEELVKLLKSGCSKAEAARKLGVTRKTIYNKIKYLEELQP